jgi:hypothetical protein
VVWTLILEVSNGAGSETQHASRIIGSTAVGNFEIGSRKGSAYGKNVSAVIAPNGSRISNDLKSNIQVSVMLVMPGAVIAPSSRSFG